MVESKNSNLYVVRGLCVFFMVMSGENLCYTIAQSGAYVLGQDIAEAGTVISITASDVTLDLNKKIVSGGTVGIQVAAGLSNVTIKNGTVTDCDTGISILDSCSLVNLENIAIRGCSPRAFEAVGSSGNEITQLTLRNISIELCSATVGADYIMYITFTNDCLLKNITLQDNGVNTVTLKGIGLITCSRGTLDNVMLRGNIAAVFDMVYVDAVQNYLFNNVQIIGNTATNQFYGISFIAGSSVTNNICQNCIVIDNTSANGPLAGFNSTLDNIRNVWVNCLASNNLTTGAVSSASCYGFNFDQISFSHVIRCKSINNRATGNGTTNIAAGFNIGTSGAGTTGVKNSEFVDNFAQANNGFSDANSYGMRVVSNSGGNTNNIYMNNIASRNGPTTPTAGNQITSTAGTGSSPGGVPSGSLADRNISALASAILYCNIRIT